MPDRYIDPSIRHMLYMETGLLSTDKIKGPITIGGGEKSNKIKRRMSGWYNYTKNLGETFSSLTSYAVSSELETEQEEDDQRLRDKVKRDSNYSLYHISSISHPAQLQYCKAVIEKAERQLHYADTLHKDLSSQFSFRSYIRAGREGCGKLPEAV